MNGFDRLKAVTERAQNEQDLPDYLAEKIFAIVANPSLFSSFEVEIASLAEQVTLYDTYGQTGYLGMGVNSVILECALKKLTAMQAAASNDRASSVQDSHLP